VTILLGTGLLHSFSRGAWLATLTGGAFVLFSTCRTNEAPRRASGSASATPARLIGWRREKWILVVAAWLVVALLLAVQTPMAHRLARRATSVANANDFSWRNRLISYEGALQIMANHPIIGIGWRRVEPEFECFYVPPLLTEPWGIILNDYLTIGMALGIPALACFISLVWISWNRAAHIYSASKSPFRHWVRNDMFDENRSKSRLRQAYQGALIVLLIGFWFDGGLFKLALAIPFWFFLELNNSAIGDNE
jgi:O-antigen ligase